MEFLKPLVQLDFWFALQPNFLSPAFATFFFIFFAIFVVAGAITRVAARQKAPDRYAKTAMLNVGAMLMTMGFIGLAWFFFAYEGLWLIGSRFWFIVWIIALAVWTWMIIRFIRNDIPEMKRVAQSRAEANKYLPRKKRR